MSTVVRITVRETDFRIEEHWTSPTEEAILEEVAKEIRRFPTEGYGTGICNVRHDPTGLLVHAKFSRMLSCD
jgi:hypothetical protein